MADCRLEESVDEHETVHPEAAVNELLDEVVAEVLRRVEKSSDIADEVASVSVVEEAAVSKAAVEDETCYCRVCHGESEPGRELYYPCKCDGSIKYIHQDCLIEWIKHSRQSNPRCELCGAPFKFKNIYKQGAPLRLTIIELIKELLPRFFGILWWCINIVLTCVLWGLALPLFTNVWLKYSWCVVCDQFPPMNCADHFTIFTTGFIKPNWYDVVEHVTHYWFSGISHLCTILIFSFIAFEVFRVLLQEALMLEKEHVARLVKKEVNSCFQCLREIDDSNEQILSDLFALVGKCLQIEALFLPIGNILPEEDQHECREKWRMSEEESLTMKHQWLVLRKECQATFVPQPNRKFVVDPETGKIEGELDLLQTLQLDLRCVAQIKEKLDDFGSESRLPILGSLRYYCDRIADMCEQQRKTVDFPRQDAVSRHANILLIYCQGMLKIAQSLRVYRNDVEVGLDKFIEEIKQSEQLARSALEEEEEVEADEAGGSFEQLLRSHMEFELKLQEEQSQRAGEEQQQEGDGQEADEVLQDDNSDAEDLQVVEAEEEEESMFVDVDSASEAEGHNEEEEEGGWSLEQSHIEEERDEIVPEDEDEGKLSNAEQEEVIVEEEETLESVPELEPATVDVNVALDPEQPAEEVAAVERPAEAVVNIPVNVDEDNQAVPVEVPGAMRPGLPRFEQDHGLLRLGYSRWLMCMGYVVTFTAIFLVVPAIIGTLITSNTVEMKVWIDRAHLVIKEVLEQDGNVALAAKLLDYSDDLTTGLNAEQDFVSEIYLAKLKTIFEILLGYSVVVSMSLTCYLIYCTKYLTSLQWNFSVQNVVMDGCKQALELVGIICKTLFTIFLTFFVMPLMLGVVAYKSFYPNLSADMKESLKQSDAALLILAFFLYIVSLLVMFHSVFVATELRKLLKPVYLKDFLPEETVFDQAAEAAQGQVNAQLNRMHNKVANKSFLDLFRNFVLRLCVVFPGMLVTVVIPLKLGHLLSCTFTPFVLRFRNTMSDTQFPVEMVMSHILLPLLIDRLKYSSSLRSFLAFVVQRLAGYLQLESVLVVEAPAPVPVPPVVQVPAVAANLIEGVPPADDVVEQEGERVAEVETSEAAPVLETAAVSHYLSPDTKLALLILGTLSIFAVISSWCLHLPMWIGRGVLFYLNLPANNDFFNYPAGLVVTWGLGFVGQFIVKDIVQTPNGLNILSVAWKWTKLIAQIIVAGILWLGWPPLLIGYALECLAIFPFRTTLTSTPQFPFLQSWALGLILLKLFVRSVITGVFGEVDLRNQLEMLLIRGFQNFEFHHFFFKVYVPIVLPLMDVVCIPFFVARWLGMFTDSYLLRTLLVRYSMHAYLVLRCLWSLLCTLVQYLVNLHNEIRDTRYLLGTELSNRS